MFNKKTLFIMGLSLIFSPFYIAISKAQIVTLCPTCTQEATQIAQWANQLQSMAQQIQNQITQLQSIGNQVFSNTNNLSNLNQLTQQQALTNGSLNQIITRLQSGNYPVSQFPQLQQQLQQAHQVYGNQLSTLQTFYQQQQNQTNSDKTVLDQIQSSSRATVGTHSALNVNNEFQAQITSQLIKMNQNQIALGQTLATAAATTEQQKAAQDAFHKQLVDNTQNMGLHDGAGF
ncbi:hypothetical protein [Commensalibacter nepenthis]|uniref:Conjugal transfer protein TrbJ n=1 Tax=Commensalibacter nepenthis TaxID=3043872 RepID=A0ABT6QAF9_9PROT|nr:hypothetical protein [Commensalibacter sp. TBRC 10068]MDI2113889.1 hypothetical protein [Commensalibacter sp. TBRC 10068]